MSNVFIKALCSVNVSLKMVIESGFPISIEESIKDNFRVEEFFSNDRCSVSQALTEISLQTVIFTS